MHVLLVDDDRLVRASIARALRRQGLSITERGDPDAAKRALREMAIDASIVDVRLRDDPEDRSGLGVLRFARERLVPHAVAFTGSSEATLLEACQRAGATDCWIKGVLTPTAMAERLARGSNLVEARSSKLEARSSKLEARSSKIV